MQGNNDDTVNNSRYIPSDDESDRVSSCFAKLGDATRLKIFCILCHNEQCVQDLAALIGMSSPAVAHHLRILKDARLIIARRDGKEMNYKLSDTEEAQELHKAVDAIFNIKH